MLSCIRKKPQPEVSFSTVLQRTATLINNSISRVWFLVGDNNTLVVFVFLYLFLLDKEETQNLELGILPAINKELLNENKPYLFTVTKDAVHL